MESETLARWKAQECAQCLNFPEEGQERARFRVTPEDSESPTENEHFTCGRHLPSLMAYLSLQGVAAIVEMYVGDEGGYARP
jgi:hypothetical protein